MAVKESNSSSGTKSVAVFFASTFVRQNETGNGKIRLRTKEINGFSKSLRVLEIFTSMYEVFLEIFYLTHVTQIIKKILLFLY